MQRVSIILLFLCIISSAYSQDYDLVYTTTGDSIACRIDSITDAAVYLKMKHNNKWVNTNVRRDEVIEYKYDAIYKHMVEFRPGTSYISRTYDNQNEANLMKAIKLQRSGKVTTIVGGSIIGASALTSAVFYWGQLSLGVVGFAVMTGIAGIGTMAVGIPMNITGKNRIKRITSNMNTSYSGITIDLKPCAQYNLMTQAYQPGITLRVRF